MRTPLGLPPLSFRDNLEPLHTLSNSERLKSRRYEMAEKDFAGELSKKLAAIEDDHDEGLHNDPFRARKDRHREEKAGDWLSAEERRPWEYGAYQAHRGDGDQHIEDEGWESYDEKLWDSVQEPSMKGKGKEKEETSSSVSRNQNMGAVHKRRKSDDQAAAVAGQKPKHAKTVRPSMAPSPPGQQSRLPAEMVRALRSRRGEGGRGGELDYEEGEVFRVVQRNDCGQYPEDRMMSRRPVANTKPGGYFLLADSAPGSKRRGIARFDHFESFE